MTSSPRFTSLAGSRSSTASAGSLEHATWERATMLAVRSRPVQQLLCRLPQTQDSRLRRGRWHSIGRFWLSFRFHEEGRFEFHGLGGLKRSLRHRCSAAQLQSVAPPPALPLLFLLNQWVCLQWKEGEEEEGAEDEEGGWSM